MLEDINVATMTKNLKQELGAKDTQHGAHLHRFDVAIAHQIWRLCIQKNIVVRLDVQCLHMLAETFNRGNW